MSTLYEGHGCPVAGAHRGQSGLSPISSSDVSLGPPESRSPISAKASAGKTITVTSPAPTSAVAVAGYMMLSISPIWVATTMNDSDVAWSSPAAAVLRVAKRDL